LIVVELEPRLQLVSASSSLIFSCKQLPKFYPKPTVKSDSYPKLVRPNKLVLELFCVSKPSVTTKYWRTKIMARSFAITTPADSLRLDAKGHVEVVFMVTNTTRRPIRGMAKVKALGVTKSEWLRIEGDTERDFAAHDIRLG
jgi:hypothetical protein